MSRRTPFADRTRTRARRVGVEGSAPTKDASAAPYSLPGEAGGVLLLHGLTGSPWDLRPIAEGLAAAGYRVDAPRLAGHASLESLARSRAADWISASERAFDTLAAAGPVRAVVGFSMGSLLALRLASARPDLTCVAMSVPLELPRWQAVGAGALGWLREKSFGRLIGHHQKSGGVDVRSGRERARNPGFGAIPYASIAELARLQADVRVRLSDLRSPLLLIHGRHDHAAPVEHSRRVSQCVSSAVVRRVVLEHSFHLLGRDLERGQVVREVVDFVCQHGAAARDDVTSVSRSAAPPDDPHAPADFDT